MKRILYICPSSNVGSAETFLLQSQRHKSEAFENHYLLFTTGPLYDQLKAMGASVHLLNSPAKISKATDRKRVADKIKQLINQFNIDLVHSTTARAALFSAKICKQMQTPHVWFQHGLSFGWQERLASILPHNGLIVNSHYTGKAQRHIENPFRFLIPRPYPIEKILLGTSQVQWSEAEISNEKNQWLAQCQCDPKSRLIAMLCKVEERKGVHVLLEALKQLADQDNLPPYQCIIFGKTDSNNPYVDLLKKKIRDNNLPVHFAGYTKNPSLALACCDIYVNASIRPEAFGVAIIEAMMVGTVPIAPSEGGPVEIINHGKNGLIFQARQPSSLMQQLKILLMDPALLQKLSEEAKHTAEQKFNAQRAISHLENFHLKIIDRVAID